MLWINLQQLNKVNMSSCCRVIHENIKNTLLIVPVEAKINRRQIHQWRSTICCVYKVKFFALQINLLDESTENRSTEVWVQRRTATLCNKHHNITEFEHYKINVIAKPVWRGRKSVAHSECFFPTRCFSPVHLSAFEYYLRSLTLIDRALSMRLVGCKTYADLPNA